MGGKLGPGEEIQKTTANVRRVLRHQEVGPKWRLCPVSIIGAQSYAPISTSIE